MGRLKIVLFIAAFVATAQTSPAQQQYSEASRQPAGQPGFVVVGDVQTPDHFPLSASRTTVREAVMSAVLLSDSVSVSILRGTQDRVVWTQMISATGQDSGELVMNDDVLVVQSMSPVAVPYMKNAALRTEGGVHIIELKSDVIAVGDVMQQTVGLPSPEHLVNITCRFQGRSPVAKANLSERVAHGDVITVSRGSRTLMKGFGSIVPAFSEWTEPAPVAIPRSTSVDPTHLQNEASPTMSFDQMDGPPLQMTDAFAFPMMEPAEPVESPVVGDSVSNSESPVAVQSVSQASPFSDVVSAPDAPIEQPIMNTDGAKATSNALSPWNLVFIGGLLAAGLLILAGSLKSEDAGFNSASSVKVSEIQSAVVTEFATNSPEADSLLRKDLRPIQLRKNIASEETAVEYVVREVTFEADAEAVVASVTPVNLVATSEWFGGDWQSKNGTVNSDRATVADATVAGRMMENEATAFVKFAVSPIGQVASEVETVTSQSDLAELEDLLQNRLPIDLCETKLPLRISLFGRPAGPRRLRIDAAHSVLSGPHTNMSAERKRDEKKTVDTAGSLDRALHSLQERTDS